MPGPQKRQEVQPWNFDVTETETGIFPPNVPNGQPTQLASPTEKNSRTNLKSATNVRH